MPDIVEGADSASPESQLFIRVSSPSSLLASVPLLLGFEPSDSSLVVIGTKSARRKVEVTVRFDIPDARAAGAIADRAISHLAPNGITHAAVVGYGPGSLVDPVAREVLSRFPMVGIGLIDALRAENQRYWSYVCTNSECCPPEGTPFDAFAHRALRKVSGKSILASRAALAQTVSTVSGEEADAMRRATRRAEARARRLIREAGNRTRCKTRLSALHNPGLLAVSDAITLYREGQSFTSHREVAWLALLLEDLPIRDDAWARMDPRHNNDHQRLWTDVTRLAQPGHVAAPASLLAFTAWQSGNGALANVALDRALADQPDYSMARLLRQALDAGAPPSAARLPLTPEEVAACYQAQDREEADDSAGSEGEQATEVAP